MMQNSGPAIAAKGIGLVGRPCLSGEGLLDADEMGRLPALRTLPYRLSRDQRN